MESCKGKDASGCAIAWEKLERLKREMRGIAPLKATDAIANAKRLRALPAPSLEPIEA
jgi:hypothetical protein